MSDAVQLPCGCRINNITVEAMCFEHHAEFRKNVMEREARWAEIEKLRRAAERSVPFGTGEQHG